MTALASRVRLARWPGMCLLCHEPIAIGQQIGKVGFWAHTACIIDRNHYRTDEDTTMTSQPRCPFRGCPTRYRGGPDRFCPMHQDEDNLIGKAARELGISMSELAASAPGFEASTPPAAS